MTHSHDEGEWGEVVAVDAHPLNAHAFISIALGLPAAIFGNVSAFFGLCAQEFGASAEYRAERRENERARREAGFELERILGQPCLPIEDGDDG